MREKDQATCATPNYVSGTLGFTELVNRRIGWTEDFIFSSRFDNFGQFTLIW
jgi:hypothetical protein